MYFIIMRKTRKDGDIRITIEGPASAFKDIKKRKRTATKKSSHARVKVVHR
jgi:acylphosphatase